MSQEHVGYPYDFAKHDPIEEFWAAHGNYRFRYERPAKSLQDADPWCNGRYALAALVWGLIIMLVVSVMA